MLSAIVIPAIKPIIDASPVQGWAFLILNQEMYPQELVEKALPSAFSALIDAKLVYRSVGAGGEPAWGYDNSRPEEAPSSGNVRRVITGYMRQKAFEFAASVRPDAIKTEG